MPRERLSSATAEALVAPQTMEGRIDRHGDLAAEIVKMEGQIETYKKVTQLRDKIAENERAMAALQEEILKEATANLGNESATEVHGARFYVKIGKCAMRRAITDMKKAAELVGFDNFFELCKFPLGRVDDYLNPKERELVLSVDHDGARTFNIKPR